MSQNSIRRWYLVHKWTSLICTAFLLLLCLTGLPLIFHEEIDYLTDEPLLKDTVDQQGPPPSLDEIVASALKAQPGQVMLYLSQDDEKPIYYATTAPRVDSGEDEMKFQLYDSRTGEHLTTATTEGDFLHFLLDLHASLLLGLPGELFLAFIGLIFAVAMISGVVVYAPFMRKISFGTVRKDRSKRIKWLDMHNMTGIITFAWLFVVGVTGIITALNTPIVDVWKNGQLAEMTAAYKEAAPPRSLSSVEAAVKTAAAEDSEMSLSFIAWPGTPFSSQNHYAVFLKGSTPLTQRLIKPALIDAETGALTDFREMPMFVQALLISQPLHFGDYGGLPLKIVWALLDIAAIVVLISGLYLWLGRRRTPIEKRLAELTTGAAAETQS